MMGCELATTQLPSALAIELMSSRAIAGFVLLEQVMLGEEKLILTG